MMCCSNPVSSAVAYMFISALSDASYPYHVFKPVANDLWIKPHLSVPIPAGWRAIVPGAFGIKDREPH